MPNYILKRPQNIDASIGYKNPGFNEGLGDDIVNVISGSRRNAENKKLHVDSIAKLKNSPSYGTDNALDLLQSHLEGVDIFQGTEGAKVIQAAAKKKVGGVSGAYGKPVIGNQFFIGVRDNINNVNSLSTLAHEGSHYLLGHTNRGNYPAEVIVPPRSRKEVSRSQKEFEAELAAAQVMNRLGYGYAPGLADKTGAYLYPHADRLSAQEMHEARLNSASVATEMVPDVIRRFGPLSRAKNQNTIPNPFIRSESLADPSDDLLAKLGQLDQTIDNIRSARQAQLVDRPEMLRSNESAQVSTTRKLTPYLLGAAALGGGLYLSLPQQPTNDMLLMQQPMFQNGVNF